MDYPLEVKVTNGVINITHLSHSKELIFSFRPDLANYENVRKWIEALLSGSYLQGQDVLKCEMDDETMAYCCLGVAAELHGIANSPQLIRTNSFIDKKWFETNFFSFVSSIDFQEFLADLNDSHYTFDQIAGLLEEILPYFTDTNG